MKPKVSQISGLDLSELLCLFNRINRLIENFSHVSGHIPPSLINSIDKQYNVYCNEQDRRERNELDNY